MKIKSIGKAVLLLALLTSTSFAAGIPSMPKKVRKCM